MGDTRIGRTIDLAAEMTLPWIKPKSSRSKAPHLTLDVDERERVRRCRNDGIKHCLT